MEGKVPQALESLEAARKLAPGREEIAFNLKAMEARTADYERMKHLITRRE